MNKKLLTTLCAFVLAFMLLLTACQGSTPTAEPGGEATTKPAETAKPTDSTPAEEPAEATALEPVTFTLYYGDINNTTFVQPNTTTIWQKIMELTGVDLTVEYIVGQDEQQKAGIMIAADEFPDLMIPHDAARQFVDAGALLPINDLIQEHGQTILSVYGDYIARMYKDAYGGNIYSWTPFGMSRDLETVGSGFYMAAAALEAAGWPVITTADEYFNTIVEFAKANPTMNGQKTVAFSGPAEGWRMGFFTMGGDKLVGMHNTGGMYYDPDNNWKATHRSTMPQRKEYFKRMFDLNQQGMLDPELFSQTYDQYVAKIASGSVVGMFDEYWEISSAVDNLKRNPEMMGAYPVAMPIKNEGVANDSYRGLSVVGTTEGVCITKKCADPVRAMQFFDRMAQDDILRLIKWGIEGEHYIVNAQGRLDQTDEQWEARRQADFSETTGIAMGLLWNFPHYMEDWVDYSDGIGPYDVKYCDKNIERLYTAEQQAILDHYGWKTFTEPFGPNFVSPFGFGWDINIPPEDDQLNEINAAINEVQTDTYYQKMILAKDEAEFNKLWDELVERLSKIDIATLEQYFEGEAHKRIEEWN